MAFKAPICWSKYTTNVPLFTLPFYFPSTGHFMLDECYSPRSIILSYLTQLYLIYSHLTNLNLPLFYFLNAWICITLHYMYCIFKMY